MALQDQHGQELFVVVRLGLVCEACARSGSTCNHLLSLNPEWKPPERMAKTDAILSTNPAMRDAESRGVVMSSTRHVLQEAQIKRFKEREPFDFPEGRPDVLYTAIDPSGGGAGSDYVILTLALCQGRVVVSRQTYNDDGRRPSRVRPNSRPPCRS